MTISEKKQIIFDAFIAHSFLNRFSQAVDIAREEGIEDYDLIQACFYEFTQNADDDV